MLGPLYGIFVVWAARRTGSAVFWINVPLAAIAMVMIHFSLPSRERGEEPRERVDVVGGAAAGDRAGPGGLGPVQPGTRTASRCCPSWGVPVLCGALVAAVAFAIWERFARTRLIEPAGVQFRPFLAALWARRCAAGAALMVTLVDVELFGQGVLRP